MKRCLLILSMAFFVQANSQQSAIDSLKHLLAQQQKTAGKDRANTLNSLGKLYTKESDYVGALQLLNESLAIAEQIGEKYLQAQAYKSISVIYFHQHEFDKAEALEMKAYAIFGNLHNKAEQALILKGLADDYLLQGDSVKSRKYYKDALGILIEQGDKIGEAAVYTNLAILFNSDFEKKISMGLKAKQIWDANPHLNVLPEVNTGNIGVAYLDIVRYDSLYHTKPSAHVPASKQACLFLAEKYLREAINLAGENKDVENAAYFTGVLAELQENRGDFKNAYYNFRTYQNTTDSIFSQENKNKIAALEGKRAMDLKNKEIENKELQISNQHKKMWLLASFILFLAIVGALLYRQTLIRKKTNNTLLQLNAELDEANKIKARFFGIISHDLRSPVANLINFIQLQKLKPDLLTENQKSEREKKITGSATSLLETMETMLLWSKGQMEHFKPSMEQVPVKVLFQYLNQFFPNSDQCTLQFTGNHDMVLQTDKDYLQTIMQNLTANAMKALQQSPNAIIVWKAWQEAGMDYLSITDNGSGATADQLKALFSDATSIGSKHGLGLHIIRDLAKAIHCKISLQNKEGEGLSFILAIPPPLH